MVRLRDRWDILLDMPLPDLRAPTAPAYAVEDQRSVGTSFFALVGEPGQPIRGVALNLARMTKHGHVLTPVEYGAVDWPSGRQRRLAVIYERPAGGRLAASAEQEIAPWPEQEIVDRVLVGLLFGLRALGVEGMTHRAIRPPNIFFRDAARRLAVLGDCVMAPPAAHQPIAYETIEGGMALPAARGNGTSADDLYALGVLCLHLAQGVPPGHGLAGEAVLEEKIRRGSFNALAAEARVSPGLLELLRGLLVDEPEERWTLKEVEQWLGGRRLTPKLTSPAPRASRPFAFGTELYFTARLLGRALVRTGEQGVHLVRSHGLEVWLQRSLGNKSVAEGVAQALASGEDPAGGNAAQDARLIARAAIALDPAAPIRYRSLAIAIDGLGSVLASAMLAGGDLNLPAEILLARLPQFWCQRQPPARAEFLAHLREYERLRRILDDHRLGFGIERLAYELNPGLHCLSPFVAAGLVSLLADLLPALEAATVEGRIQAQPIDRHVAAFIAHRSKQIDEAVLALAGSADPLQRLLGTLHLLAQLQHDRGPATLPALTGLFAPQVQLLINRFRHRGTRERLGSELAATLAEANLPRLLHFLDNAEDKRNDADLFSKARLRFNLTARAVDRCERERSHVSEAAEQTASAIAAGVSMLVAVIAVAASILTFGSF